MVESQRQGLARWVNYWLALSGAGPYFDLDLGLLVPSAAGSLFGALTHQVVSLAQGTRYAIECAICGTFEERTDRPQANRHHYCTDKPDCAERGRRRLSYAKNQKRKKPT